MLRRTIGYFAIRVIKQGFNSLLNKWNKSKLSLGVAEQLAREYGGEGDIRIEGERSLPRLGVRGGAWLTSEGRKGRPFLGAPLLSRPANHPNPFPSFDFRFGLGGGLGSGEERCLGEGCLDCDPDPRGWVTQPRIPPFRGEPDGGQVPR